ncbi:MAG: hypothetical protein ACTS73_05470 [Arsenophonus sp. NEOnobi-MAG3]
MSKIRDCSGKRICFNSSFLALYLKCEKCRRVATMGGSNLQGISTCDFHEVVGGLLVKNRWSLWSTISRLKIANSFKRISNGA